jgi:hypothetical protein
MRKRCRNKKDPKYPRYGGRGIKVCARWSKFENFFADMGLPPSPAHSLDRIDVNGDYEPGNCRWATQKTQQNNRGNTRMITLGQKTLKITEWEIVTGIPARIIRQRLDRDGMPVKDALSRPRSRSRKPWR